MKKAPLSIASLVLLAACSQDAGESCQRSRDCADGLVCEIAVRSERGMCVDPAEQRDAGNADAGDEPDLPPDDGGASDGGDAGDGGASDDDAG